MKCYKIPTPIKPEAGKMNVFVELLEENLVLLTLTHMDGYTMKLLRALFWVFL